MRDLASAVWRKSTYSAENGCVEVAFLVDHVAVRNSRQRHGPVLLFTATEWRAFVGGVEDGEFKLPGTTAWWGVNDPDAGNRREWD
jgi:hypothetical protein